MFVRLRYFKWGYFFMTCFFVGVVGMFFQSYVSPEPVEANFSDTAVTDSALVTDGQVYTSVVDDDGILYVGGSFTSIGHSTNRMTVVNTSTAAVSSTFPGVDDGVVRVAIPDGNDGWYIAGSFTSIDGVTRDRIAQINSAGALTSWNPDVLGGTGISTMVTDGTYVYIGGYFNSVGGTSITSLAAVSVADGTLNTDWTPNPNFRVDALLLSDGILYVGGAFTTIDSVSKNRAAAFDTTNSLAITAWNPNVSGGGVLSLAVDDTTVYLGGEFSTISGNSRSYIGAHNKDNSTSDWNASVTSIAGGVYALEISGTTLYMGGSFTEVTSTARNNLAAVSTVTGDVTAWDPDVADGYVSDILIDGTSLYAGGSFSDVNGGTVRNMVAEFAIIDGTVTSFDPSFGGPSLLVYGLSTSTAGLFAGGSFTLSSASTRNYIAAIDPTTLEVTSFDPNVGSTVRSLDVDGTTLFAGGDFTMVNGATTRNYLASFDTTAATANVTDWDPNIAYNMGQPAVYSVLVDSASTTVYVGGAFNTVNGGGTTRNRLASFNYVDENTGTATDWDPDVVGSFGFGGTIYALDTDGTYIYAAGDMATAGGTDRNNAASFDKDLGALTAWNPDIPGNFGQNMVYALAVDTSTVYIGGNFATVNNDVTRNGIAAFDNDTGTVTDWAPDINDSGTHIVRSLLLDGNVIYVGGNFTSGSNLGLAAFTLNENTDNLFADFTTDLSDGVTSGVTSLTKVTDEGLFVGGDFTGYLTEFPDENTAPTVSTLAPTAVVDGSSSDTTQPTFTFTLADTDSTDRVQYRLQVDDSSDFSSPVIDYSSHFFLPEAVSFTVGQAAVYEGTYTVGSESQTLDDGSYYWRVKAIDNSAAESAYSSANSGAVAFIVDTAVDEVVADEEPAVVADEVFGGSAFEFLRKKKTVLDNTPPEETLPPSDENTCVLSLNKSYKNPNRADVWYVAKGVFVDDAPCYRRVYTTLFKFSTYFPSFDSIVVDKRIDDIPIDPVMFLPKGPLWKRKYGAVVKTLTKNDVYLLIGNIKYTFDSGDVFTSLGYSFSWVEDVDSRVLDQYTFGEHIDYVDHHPEGSLVKYEDSPKVYRLDMVDSILVKRHIFNPAAFDSLDYRWDRILTIPQTEVYTEGTPIFQ